MRLEPLQALSLGGRLRRLHSVASLGPQALVNYSKVLTVHSTISKAAMMVAIRAAATQSIILRY
jgi:hypothetical protein